MLAPVLKDSEGMQLLAWLGQLLKLCPQASLFQLLHPASLCVGLIVGSLFPRSDKMARSMAGLHSISSGTPWEREHPFWAYTLFQQKWKEVSLASFRSHAIFYPTLVAMVIQYSHWQAESHDHSWTHWISSALLEARGFSLAQHRSHNPIPSPGWFQCLVGQAWVMWSPLAL